MQSMKCILPLFLVDIIIKIEQICFRGKSVISQKHRIDSCLFERKFDAFKKFAEEKTNVVFISFVSYRYT